MIQLLYFPFVSSFKGMPNEKYTSDGVFFDAFNLTCYNHIMDYGIILTTILGSAGLFSLIQFLITRHDKKNDDIKQIKNEITKIKSTQEQTILRVTRMELLSLMDKQPNNIDAILQVAEYYFIELSGNAYAHSLFEKWALEHNVAIGWLPKLRKAQNNEKGSKTRNKK